MVLTTWIRKRGDTVEIAPNSPRLTRGRYITDGYTPVPPELAHLPDFRLDIVDGAVVELPEPPPTEEWVRKSIFLDTLLAFIPEEKRPVIATDWRTSFGIAQLPGEQVDLLDPRVEMFVGLIPIPMDVLREAIYAQSAITEDTDVQ